MSRQGLAHKDLLTWWERQADQSVIMIKRSTFRFIHTPHELEHRAGESKAGFLSWGWRGQDRFRTDSGVESAMIQIQREVNHGWKTLKTTTRTPLNSWS